MNAALRKSFLGLALGYVLILTVLLYWQLFAPIGEHPANPRYYQVFQQARGAIYDRKGRILAETRQIGEKYTRYYATPSLSHVVGYFHPRYGITGLERLYHEELLAGRQIITTLDLELQIFAEKELGERPGAIIAIDPRSGEVLALVSSPCIDGNALAENWSDYLVDLRSPFLNRVTQGLYPPGSAIKPLLYGAALTQGLTTPDTIWDDGGYLSLGNKTIQNSGKRAHGLITSEQALAFSSNVVFAQLANSLGNSMFGTLQDFGLGRELSFELKNQGGFIPQSLQGSYDLAQVGIGQGELLVTPLQMATVVATLANRGVRLRPFVVKELRGGLKMRQFTRPQIESEPFTAQIARLVRDAMVLAVEKGTAQNALLEGVLVAAKTGTAQTGHGLDHSWFIGFAPADRPRVAVAVVVEHGGTGGTVATPLGARVLAKALDVEESER